MAEPATLTAVRNPYPGLRPFRTAEEHLYFGREHQVDSMIDKLAANRFLAVVGGSGSGKSSLVNCGLRPALHRGYMVSAGAAWRMAQFRPGSDPIGALAHALAEPGVLFDQPVTSGALSTQALVESTLRLGSLGLVDIVEQADLPDSTRLLVVADQFEELFRFRSVTQGANKTGWSPTEDAVALVRLLLEAAAQADRTVYVVLTMRSDFLGDCAQFQGLPEIINRGQYLVPRLSRNEIRAAITGPAGVAEATISPVLVTRLLNDVGDNPDQLSILQHALNRTWAYWEADVESPDELALKHYDLAGGMASALDQHADKAFAELVDPASQTLCEKIFKALTDMGTDSRGIRRPMPLSILAEMTGAPVEQLQAVIDVFRKPSRSFLMPPLAEKLTGDSVIDISHESLMRLWSRLKTWATDEARSARIYRRLRETALEREHGHASLWRDPDLRVALDWCEKNKPTRAWAELYGGDFEVAMAFLDQSRAAQVQEKRDAEIESRWLSRWSYLPLALVFLAFMFVQGLLADMLSASDWSVPFLNDEQFKAADHSRFLSNLFAGSIAATAYLALTPFIKKRFPIWDAWIFAGSTLDSSVDVVKLGHAGFWRRATVHLIELALICIVIVLASFCMFYLWLKFRYEKDAFDVGVFSSLIIPLFIPFLYYVGSWTSKHQATWGMRIAGIFITDLQGRRLSRARASGRFFARFLSYYTLGLGFLMQPFNSRRQTLHDKICGTLVLNRPPQPKPAPPLPADPISTG